MLAELVGKGPTFDQLHHEDVVTLVGDDIEQRDDVVVADRCGRAGLAE